MRNQVGKDRLECEVIGHLHDHAAFAHHARGGLHEEERCAQVDRLHRVPVGRGDGIEGVSRPHRRGAYHDIELAEDAHRFTDNAFGDRRIGEIGLHDVRLGALRTQRCGKRLGLRGGRR